MLLISFLAISSIFEYQSSGLDEKIIWRNLQQIPLFFITIVLFYIVMVFLHFPIRKIKLLTSVFSILTAIYIILIMTDEIHGWMRHAIALENVGGFVRTSVEVTYLNRVFIVSNYFLLFFTLITMLIRSIKSRRSTRLQHWIIFTAVLIPIFHGITKRLSETIDVTPMAPSYLICGLLLFWGLFRYRLTDVWPAASDVLYEHMQDGILVVDANGTVVHVNSQAKKYLSPIIPSFNKLVAGEDIQVHTEENESLDYLIKAQTNQEIELEVDVNYYSCLHIDRLNVTDQLTQPIGQLWVIKDYTDRKLREKELWKRATEDSLTELMNRQYFFERMEAEMNNRQVDEYHTMILLDIDYFKVVNDRYGHYIGDIVLKGFARILKNSLYDSAFVGRIGGEEFAIFHKPTTPQESIQMGEEILQRMRTTSFESTTFKTFNCTVSLGIVITNKELSINHLYQMSDDLLYQSKEAGRDRLTADYIIKEKENKDWESSKV